MTLKSVGETSSKFATIPDYQGRDNLASHALVDINNLAKVDMALMMNASSGQFFVGESGTELLFRKIRTACVHAPRGTKVLVSSLEHPASRSAARRWAGIAGLERCAVERGEVVATAACHGQRRAGQVPRRIRGEQADWLRARMADGAVTLRGPVVELAEGGLRVDYRTMWAFAHAEGLGFKKNRARQ